MKLMGKRRRPLHRQKCGKSNGTGPSVAFLPKTGARGEAREIEKEISSRPKQKDQWSSNGGGTFRSLWRGWVKNKAKPQIGLGGWVSDGTLPGESGGT